MSLALLRAGQSATAGRVPDPASARVARRLFRRLESDCDRQVGPLDRLVVEHWFFEG